MFKFASLAVLALAALGARADLVVSTESLTLCQPATFQISGSATGPYWAYIVSTDDLCGDALVEIENISGNSFTWTVNVTSVPSVTIALEAQDGSEAWSGGMTIATGDSSCLSSSSSSSTTTTSTTHSTAHGTTLTAPANAVSNTANTAEDNNTSTSGASSRAVVGVTSVAALLSAAVMAFSL